MRIFSKYFILVISLASFLILKINAQAEVVVGPQIDIYVGPNMQAEPAAVYDSINRRFLVVWDERLEGRANIYGQLVNSDGSLYAGRIAICEAQNNQYAYGPQVAFDSVNQRFLVLWGDNHIHQPEGVWVAETYAQFVNSDGSPIGGNFAISPDPIQVGSTYPVAITFDTVQNRFLALMYLRGNAIGQFVNPDGSLAGGYFPITNYTAGYGVAGVRLGYDSNNDRFLVAYGNGDDGDIYGRMLNGDGTFYSAEFIISDTGGPGEGNYIVSISFDPVNNRFLAVFDRVWWRHIVQGQLINADASLYGSPITIFDYRDGGSAIFDPVNNKFLVTATYGDTQGQLLNTDGSFFGSSFLIEPSHFPYPPILAGDSLSIGSLVVWSVDLGMGTDRDIVGRIINLVNQPPVLDPISNQEVYWGDLLSFEVSGSDPDGDRLYLTSANLPTGATLTDNGDGTAAFSWIPTYAQVKQWTVTFQISDGNLSDQKDASITVKKRQKGIKRIEQY